MVFFVDLQSCKRLLASVKLNEWHLQLLKKRSVGTNFVQITDVALVGTAATPPGHVLNSKQKENW